MQLDEVAVDDANSEVGVVSDSCEGHSGHVAGSARHLTRDRAPHAGRSPATTHRDNLPEKRRCARPTLGDDSKHETSRGSATGAK